MQIVKMFAVVISIFVVCWAPYHVYFILVFHAPAIRQVRPALPLYRSYPKLIYLITLLKLLLLV